MTAEHLEAWTASGAAALTGRRGGPPLDPPPGFIAAVARLGDALGVDAFALLAERAAITGFTRNGDASCGGGTRLLPVADGWIAASLTRTDDIELLPAWLERDVTGAPFAEVAANVHDQTAREVVERARLLGLPVAALGEVRDTRAVIATGSGARPVGAQPLVLDLSSLWAGPLCSRLLLERGARVMKVESRARPDGARRGPRAFFDRLNVGKECLVLDFDDGEDRRRLRELITGADVVIDASRPRALEQLGIFAEEVLQEGPAVWVSITGYGRAAPMRDWVAFGDDAAVAGGLVAWDDAGPCFCADAIADPLTGMTAAVAVLDALARDERVLLDVALARVAASTAFATRDFQRLDAEALADNPSIHRDETEGTT